MSTSLRVSAAGIAVLAIAALTTGLASADPSSPRISFFACASGSSVAKSVPAGVPLFVPGGFSSGTRGLVVAATGKIQNTFSVTFSVGGSSTFNPAFGTLVENPDGTWTAPFRVDLPTLASGNSMTIHWAYTVSQPFKELVPPSSDWDPVANFQPPWDGTGLKFESFTAAGVYDLGICTVTAV
jgi:hypothetical protein